MTITAKEYSDMEDDFYGYCTACKDWTRDCTETDARGYDCPQCGLDTVLGASEALLEGELCISG